MEVNTMERVAVPAPEVKKEEQEVITAQSIQDEILGLNDAGYSRSNAVIVLEKLHNINKGIENLEESDREYVREVDPEYFKVDMMQFTDKIVNVIMHFDTEKDVYLREIMDLFKQYKNCTVRANEQFAAKEENSDEDIPVPIVTITFLPLKYKGCAYATFANPIGFFRTIDDNGVNCQLHMMFDIENIEYEAYDLNEDDLIDIQAGIMREQEMAENAEYRSSF